MVLKMNLRACNTISLKDTTKIISKTLTTACKIISTTLFLFSLLIHMLFSVIQRFPLNQFPDSQSVKDIEGEKIAIKQMKETVRSWGVPFNLKKYMHHRVKNHSCYLSFFLSLFPFYYHLFHAQVNVFLFVSARTHSSITRACPIPPKHR